MNTKQILRKDLVSAVTQYGYDNLMPLDAVAVNLSEALYDNNMHYGETQEELMKEIKDTAKSLKLFP